jgi:hypothetical protein
MGSIREIDNSIREIDNSIITVFDSDDFKRALKIPLTQRQQPPGAGRGWGWS